MYYYRGAVIIRTGYLNNQQIFIEVKISTAGCGTPQLFECNKPVCAKWKYALFKILNLTIARGVSHLVKSL